MHYSYLSKQRKGGFTSWTPEWLRAGRIPSSEPPPSLRKEAACPYESSRYFPRYLVQCSSRSHKIRWRRKKSHTSAHKADAASARWWFSPILLGALTISKNNTREKMLQYCKICVTRRFEGFKQKIRKACDENCPIDSTNLAEFNFLLVFVEIGRASCRERV